MCEQEQLASDLDRALSLSQLGSLGGAPHKLTSNTKSEKRKSKSVGGALKERIHSSGIAGKLKAAAKASETAQRLKGQKKMSVFSPVRSELSSCSNSEYLQNLVSLC